MAFLITSLPKNRRKIPRRSNSQMLCHYIQQCFQMVGYYNFGEGLFTSISNGLYHSKHKKVLPHIQTLSYRSRFLPSTEQESLGKKKAHKQREETRLKSFTGQLSKMATSVCYQSCQLSPFINKISRSAYILPFDVSEIYLGFTYQPVCPC